MNYSLTLLDSITKNTFLFSSKAKKSLMGSTNSVMATDDHVVSNRSGCIRIACDPALQLQAVQTEEAECQNETYVNEDHRARVTSTLQPPCVKLVIPESISGNRRRYYALPAPSFPGLLPAATIHDTKAVEIGSAFKTIAMKMSTFLDFQDAPNEDGSKKALLFKKKLQEAHGVCSMKKEHDSVTHHKSGLCDSRSQLHKNVQNHPLCIPSQETQHLQPPAVETSLNKLFKRNCILGEGTYGVVYKAVKRCTGELVALKKLRWPSPHDGIPATSVREVALLRQLDHPNIVKLNSVHYQKSGTLDGKAHLFLEFEFLELDLRKYMKMFPKRQMPLDTIRYILYQILQALEYCHARNVIHRDIKPNNILLSIQRSKKRAASPLSLNLPCSQRVCRIHDKPQDEGVVTQALDTSQKSNCAEGVYTSPPKKIVQNGFSQTIHHDRWNEKKETKMMECTILHQLKTNDTHNSYPLPLHVSSSSSSPSSSFASSSSSSSSSASNASAPRSSHDDCCKKRSHEKRKVMKIPQFTIVKVSCIELNKQVIQTYEDGILQNSSNVQNYYSTWKETSKNEIPPPLDGIVFKLPRKKSCFKTFTVSTFSLFDPLNSIKKSDEKETTQHKLKEKNREPFVAKPISSQDCNLGQTQRQPRDGHINQNTRATEDQITNNIDDQTLGEHLNHDAQDMAEQMKNFKVKLADFGLARAIPYPLRPMTHEVVTLWYRAPEILLGYENYTSAIDLWSIGCLFIELLFGRALFSGEAEIDTLFKIFQLLGTPSPSTWNGLRSLPHYTSRWPKWPKRSDRYNHFRADLDDDAKNLIDRLLSYDPQQRITASEALKHPWFDKVRHV